MSRVSARRGNMRPFITIVGGAVAAAMIFGSGWRMSTKKVQKIENDRRIATEALRTSQLALQGREATLHQLEARRQLDLAQLALGQRNYGVARERVSEALARLATARRIGAVSSADLGAAQGILAGLREIDDTAAPRLADAARAMDEQFLKTIPPPDSVSPVTVPPPTANDAPLYPEIGR